jgi:steroid delta-isomerase-like uncharacterized protein
MSDHDGSEWRLESLPALSLADGPGDVPAEPYPATADAPGGVDAPYGTSGWYPASPGPQTANKQLLQRYVRSVIDGQNAALADFYFTENFYNNDRAPGEELGLQGVKKFLASIFAAFSGFRTHVRQQIGDRDFVVGHWAQQFTNTGSYLGIPPSGRHVNIGGITITRVQGGKIAEEWEARDALALLTQMGAAPMLGPLEGGVSPAVDQELVSRYFYDVWSGGRVELVDEIFAPGYVNNNLLAGQRPGREGVRQFVRAWRAAFPDTSVAVDLLLSEGDRVVARWTVLGTHRGTFLGIPATGKPVTVTGITIYRVSDGAVRESWGFWEQLTLLDQLGLLGGPPTLPSGRPGSTPPPAPGPPPTPTPTPPWTPTW